MRPCTLHELIVAVGGRPFGVGPERVITGVSIDSRRVQPGDVFWAIRGERFDGHNFVFEAMARGAAACVVESPAAVANGPRETPAVIVDDSRTSLAEFARCYRGTLDALVIGVTGSVGKTTTRGMLHALLATRFAGMQSPGNFNNELGVPLSLLAIEPEHEFAVLELAAARAGDIAALARLAGPEAAIITAVAPAHLATFGSLDIIERTKAELVEAVPEGGFVVLNGDDPRVRGMARLTRARVITVGTNPENMIVAERIEQDNDRLSFHVDGRRFAVPAIGRHHVTAALCSIAVAREIGLEEDDIARGLLRFSPPPGRCERRRIGEWTVLNDCYNANPASMQAALDVLQAWKGPGQRVLVLGDMLELGPEAHDWHARLGADIAARRFDRLVALGPWAAVAADSARSAGMDPGCIGVGEDLATLHCLLDCWLSPGDTVLVKGSRGMQLERIIAELEQRAAAAAPCVPKQRAA